MTEETVQQFMAYAPVQQLIDYALAGKHRPCELLQDAHAEYAAKKLYSAVVYVITTLETAEKRAMKQYGKTIRAGSADTKLLPAFKTFQKCRKFYEEELANIDHMLNEFYAYRTKYSWFDIYLFNRERETFEQFDHLEHADWIKKNDECD